MCTSARVSDSSSRTRAAAGTVSTSRPPVPAHSQTPAPPPPSQTPQVITPTTANTPQSWRARGAYPLSVSPAVSAQKQAIRGRAGKQITGQRPTAGAQCAGTAHSAPGPQSARNQTKTALSAPAARAADGGKICRIVAAAGLVHSSNVARNAAERGPNPEPTRGGEGRLAQPRVTVTARSGVKVTEGSWVHSATATESRGSRSQKGQGPQSVNRSRKDQGDTEGSGGHDRSPGHGRVRGHGRSPGHGRVRRPRSATGTVRRDSCRLRLPMPASSQK